MGMGKHSYTAGSGCCVGAISRIGGFGGPHRLVVERIRSRVDRAAVHPPGCARNTRSVGHEHWAFILFLSAEVTGTSYFLATWAKRIE